MLGIVNEEPLVGKYSKIYTLYQRFLLYLSFSVKLKPLLLLLYYSKIISKGVIFVFISRIKWLWLVPWLVAKTLLIQRVQ